MPAHTRSRPTAFALLAAIALCAPAFAQDRVVPQDLGRLWDAGHVSPPLPPLIDHADVVRRLNGFVAAAPDLLSVEIAGTSVEGRSINHVRAGTGPLGVLLWSQMHGDEPTATAALFDVLAYLTRRRGDPIVQRLLSR